MKKLLLCVAVLGLGFLLASEAGAASLSTSIVTDTSDYAPGDTVYITGTGFWANESVRLEIHNVYNPGKGEVNTPWTTLSNAGGDISTFWIVPPDGVDQTFRLTATGLSSAITATTYFTDANSKLDITSDLPDSVCTGSEFTVCAYLRQPCGGNNEAPLVGRVVGFYFNPGNCSNDNQTVPSATAVTDSNGFACAVLTAPLAAGGWTVKAKFLGESQPLPSQPPNSACDPTQRVSLSTSTDCQSFKVSVSTGVSPTVTLPPNDTADLCLAGPYCLPVTISDGDCDIDTVITNIGTYSGQRSNFDQIGKLRSLGGTVTQVGGGFNGKSLFVATDFVAPVNALSGVSVTLPNFIFATSIANYGSFPSGVGPAQSADQLKGSPTDLSFTLAGAGGPDGGNGDGSVTFAVGNLVTVGFSQLVTTCNGQNVDFVIFANSSSSGSAEILFLRSGSPVHMAVQTIPGGADGSGIGGLTIDLPDRITFNQVRIRCLTAPIVIDAFAARTVPSTSSQDLCFTPDTNGVYRIIVTAIDRCGHSGTDTTFVTVSGNLAPVANAGADFSRFQCLAQQICFPVSATDANGNLQSLTLYSGPGTLSAGQVCYTPGGVGTTQFIIKATDSCGASDYDTINVSVSLNQPPVAVNPSPITQFQCTPTAICHTFSATDPDGGPLTWTKIAGLGTLTGAQLCFTPAASGSSNATVVVTDSCGKADTTSITFNVALNSAPVAVDPATPVNISQCLPTQVCYTFAASDVNGGTLTWTKISGAGSVSAAGQWCFTPSTAGAYSVVARVADSCGRADTTTLTYNVSLNGAPTIAFGADTTLFQCTAAPICVSYAVSDPQGMGKLTELLVSGVGTLDTLANSLCFTPAASGTYQIIASVTDSCGAFDRDTINVTVTLNSPPVAVNPSPITQYQCVATQICHTFTATDVNGGALTWSLLSGVGSITTGGQLCFTPASSGTFNSTVVVTDPCGAKDTTSLTFNITFNSAPVAVNPATPVNVFQCVPTEICYTFAASDVNGGTLNWTKLSGSGTVSSAGQWCFTPASAGAYTVTARVTDSCGKADTTTLTYNVTLNGAPTIAFGADFSTQQCVPTQICLPYTVSDPQGPGKLTEILVSGTGTIDTAGNQVCFTPSVSGAYEIIAQVTDSCGASDRDTIVVTVTFGAYAAITCPSGPINQTLCAAGPICQTLAITPANATVTTSFGTYSGGNLCFQADTSGTYNIRVIAGAECGADTCDLTFVVDISTTPNLVCPGPQTKFICQAGTLCIPVGGAAVATWTVTPIGSYSGGNVCFPADTSGHYVIKVKASTPCGVDSCNVVVDVTINSKPVAVNPVTPVSAFQCAPTQICYNFSASDVNGGALTWTRLSGAGSVSSGGQWCFTPSVAGAYSVVAQVADSCGAADTVTLTYNVTLNGAPTIAFANDTTINQCVPAQICLPYTLSDPQGLVKLTETLISGSGAIDTVNNRVCFTPAASGAYQFVASVTDSCGLTDRDTIVVTVNLNATPVAANPSPITQFQCVATQLCHTFTATDADGNPLTWTLLSGVGSITSGGQLCFTPASSGSFVSTVVVSDPCGAKDTTSLTFTITLNAKPVAVEPTTPVTVFQCAAAQICYQFAASDVNGGTLTWSRLSGAGTVTGGGNWCFTPSGSGAYTVVAAVADSCGATDTVTLTYNVTINSAPSITLANDTTLFQCLAGQVCLPYAFSDANSNVQGVSLLSGSGTVTLSPAQLCFTPSTSGTYTFVAQIIDSCGATDQDTIAVTVNLNRPPVANAGVDQTVFQCTQGPICWPAGATDPDNNLASVTLFNGPGTFNGSQICFTPTGTLNYEFVLKAVDVCGLESYDTVVVYYTLNSAPVATAGPDQTLFQCTPTQVCLPVSCTDVNNNLSNCALISGPGSYNGGQICFTPTVSGPYQFILEATDACGLTDRDTVVVNMTINSTPVCSVPNDTTIFQCTSTQICLPVSGSDIDGNFTGCQIMSGPGALVGGQWCYTPVSSQVVTVTIRCTDACGAYCEDVFTVEIDINQAPTINFASVSPNFLCASQQICVGYTANDPDAGQSKTISLVSGPGSLDLANSRVCFTPVTSGTYQFVIRIQDACGLFDQDTVNVPVTINSTPVANAGPDQTVSQCLPTSICWPAVCTDIDANLTDCLFSGPGTYNGSQICFTPSASGIYQFTLQAVDACGATMTDTVIINVTINATPTVAFGNDTTLFLCAPQPICLPYAVNDGNGLAGLQEFMVSGFGAIDTVNNIVCFTPTVTGTYEIVVKVMDACGAADFDTVVANVTFGTFADIVCPTGPMVASLCGPDQVCQALTITPPGATVTTSFGTYSGGNLCFQADTSGTYNIKVIASSSCGADTCNLTFSVTIGQAAQITCPLPSTKFVCAPGSICLPVGVMGTGAVVAVSPIGSYAAGNVCFPADTSGHYVLQVIASTTCGADTCEITADVTINTKPVAVNPMTPVDTFMCASAQVCYQFAASDLNGNALTWTKLSGAGTVTAAGQWCFTPSSSGAYAIVASVADSCGGADTVSLTYNVTLNVTPALAVGNDTTIFVCTSGGNVCLPYTLVDPNNNIQSVTLLAGTGTVSLSPKEFCFAATAGAMQFILLATDSCGASDRDTINVTVTVNAPPVAAAGADQNLFMCTSTQLCWPASITDPNNNLDSAYLASGPGTFNGSQICFTPTVDGIYTFILRAKDKCGVVDEDTAVITINVNNPPVCSIPSNQNFFQCTPTQVSLPVSATDPDNNLSRCEIISGPGSIVGGNWVYTPSGDEVRKVKIQCVDSCGAACIDSFTVIFRLNAPPVANAGNDTTLFLYGASNLCFNAGAFDEDNNLQLVQLTSPNGTYDPGTGKICVALPYAEGLTKIYEFVIKATDSCGVVDYDTSVVTVKFNGPPVVAGPPEFTAYLDFIGEVCFAVNVSDPNNNVTSVNVSPMGTYSPSTGQVCFMPTSTGTYCLIITAVDAGNLTDVDTICIDVVIDECIHVQIEKIHNALQGQHNLVDLFLNGSGKPLGGFDFLVAYDASVLSPSTVTPGSLFESCGWEYFQYRVGPSGNCTNGCPTGILRIVGLAETNNGAYHPSCFFEDQYGTIGTIDFLVSNDRTLECQFAPVSFYWFDCADNTISAYGGDTVWTDRKIFDFELNRIDNHTYGLPGYYGTPDGCLAGLPGKPGLQRCIDFTNGGIDIVCADSIDARGDINLNNFPNEIADAVLFTNYFLHGQGVFTINLAGQIAASDVNADGIPLTVADLVYLVRVVIGDAPAIPKLNPGENAPEVELDITSGSLRIVRTDVKVGALALTLSGEVTPVLSAQASGMELKYHVENGQTKVLVYSSKGNAWMLPGEVLTIGQSRVVSIEAGSFDGQMLAPKLKTLPTAYALNQNYPNPFNPATTISFALPTKGQWTLTIYNVLGQEVKSWSEESEAGYYQVEWDARSNASGVYFYRLAAGGFSATKKMVLVK